MAKKIAVTGSSGYIGAMLVERLVKKPDIDRIVAIDVVKPDKPSDKVEYAECDVRDPEIVRRFEGCDTVVHLAFIVAAIHDLKKTYDINLRGTRNVLSACEKTKPDKLIVASSLAAFGRQPHDNKTITEDTPLRGESSSYYLHTKRLVEEDLDVFEKRNPDVIVTRLRPSVLLGPRNNNFAQEMGAPPITPKVREGAYLPIVHEEDVIDAFELAVDRDAPGAFIISLPEPVSLEDFAGKTTKRQVSISIKTLYKLSKIGYALRLTKLSPDWIAAAEGNWRVDNSRAREVLGWEPRHDTETTVKEMMDSLQTKTGRQRLKG